GEIGQAGGQSGRRIDDAADRVGLSEAHGVIDRLQRYLELQDDRIDLTKLGSRRVDVRRREAIIGALDHDDPILAAGRDEDRADAGGRSVDAPPVRRMDSEGGEVLHRRLAEQVPAAPRPHQALPAAQPGGDGLIGALAAEAQVEVAAEDGLPGSRKRIRERDEIGVGAADDGNSGCARHADSSGYRRFTESRSMSVTSKIVCRAGIFSPDMLTCISSTAFAPMAPSGWAIVVRRGVTTSVQRMLSKPVTDTSSGTLTSCSVRYRI